MREGEQSLSEKLERVEVIADKLERQMGAGEELLARLMRIAGVYAAGR